MNEIAGALICTAGGLVLLALSIALVTVAKGL